MSNHSTVMPGVTPAFSTHGPWLTDEEIVTTTGYTLAYFRGLRSRGRFPKSTKIIIDTRDRTGRPIRIPKGFTRADEVRAWLLTNGRPEKAEALDTYLADRRAV